MRIFLKILLSALIIIPILYFSYIEYVIIKKDITSNNEFISSLRKHHDKLLIDTKNKDISLSDRIRKLSALENKFSNLEKEFLNLKRELSQLESKLPKKTSPTNYRAKWLNLSNWRKIRQGMSEDEVISILGQPTTRNSDFGSTNLFYNGFGKSGYLKIGKFMGVFEFQEPNL